MADRITKEKTREIIEDFAKEVDKRKEQGPKPETHVIFFRNEHVENTARPVWKVPIDILRFRKKNGRISSDIRSYEKLNAPLKEESKEAQKIISQFLKEKDPEKTQELKNSLRHTGQLEPAIITADGFLINGNRRRLALQELYEEHEDDKYRFMKVVILPGEGDPGGPPTRSEIEQIENRYQLQSQGRAEYSKFDRALSIKDKIDSGYTLSQQLKDDPNYRYLSDKKFKRKLREYKREYLQPLDRVDEYLEHFERPGAYNTISRGISDKKGRWEAFNDYNKLYKKLGSEKQRYNMGIEEDEVADVMDIAFKTIRKRDFEDLPKLHQIMRRLPKWLEYKSARQELFELNKIDRQLPEEEKYDENDNEYPEREKDKLWSAKHSTELHHRLKKASNLYEMRDEQETPINLLEAAYKKLVHDEMKPQTVDKFQDMKKAYNLTKDIQEKADDLESEFWNMMKDADEKVDKLKDKFGSL